MDQAAALSHKQAGNERFAAGAYHEALVQYELALSLLNPEDSEVTALENNRAAVFLKLRRAREAAECSRRVLQTEPQNAKAIGRLVRAIAGEGNLQRALENLSEPGQEAVHERLKRDLEEAQALLAQGDKELEAGNHASALELYSKLEGDLVFDCPPLLAKMGRCYLALGEVSRAIHVSSGLLRRDASNVDALLLRAEAQFQSVPEHIEDDAWDRGAEASLRSVKQALQSDPEHAAAAQLRRRLRGWVEHVQQGRKALQLKNWSLLVEGLGKILPGTAGDPSLLAFGRFAARCFTMRAKGRFGHEDYRGCVDDCEAAMKLDNRLVATPLLHAQALQKLERWADAVTVLEALHAWKKDEDIFWKVEWAKFEVRRVQRPDYYAILGIPRTATQAEVKAAYRKMSVEMHPDKQMRDPTVDPDEARAKFQAVGEAFEFLGNEAKRDFYDRGYDAQGIRECLQVRKRFAGQAPCSKCGEDEAGKIGSDGSWYCNFCWDKKFGAAHNGTNGHKKDSTFLGPPTPSMSSSAPPSAAQGPQDAKGLGEAFLKLLLLQAMQSSGNVGLSVDELQRKAQELLKSQKRTTKPRSHGFTPRANCPPPPSVPGREPKETVFEPSPPTLSTSRVAKSAPAPPELRDDGPKRPPSPCTAKLQREEAEAAKGLGWSFSLFGGRSALPKASTEVLASAGYSQPGAGSRWDVPDQALPPRPRELHSVAAPVTARPRALPQQFELVD